MSEAEEILKKAYEDRFEFQEYEDSPLSITYSKTVLKAMKQFSDQENESQVDQLSTCQQLREVEQNEKKQLKSQLEELIYQRQKLKVGIQDIESLIEDSRAETVYYILPKLRKLFNKLLTNYNESKTQGND